MPLPVVTEVSRSDGSFAHPILVVARMDVVEHHIRCIRVVRFPIAIVVISVAYLQTGKDLARSFPVWRYATEMTTIAMGKRTTRMQRI